MRLLLDTHAFIWWDRTLHGLDLPPKKRVSTPLPAWC